MQHVVRWFPRIVEFVSATLLAALFITFLLQIFSRYILVTPFGWTLELCLILWVWIVFFACAFLVREKDHVTFDILYLAAPRKIQRIFAMIACFAVVAGMGWALYPTLDYINWLQIRSTTTVGNPFANGNIPMRTIFSIYGIFMIALMVRYIVRFVRVYRHGVPNSDGMLVPDANQEDAQ